MGAVDFERFAGFYASVGAPAVLELERRVLGTDYGANSYTDVAQAERLAGMLELGPGRLLLDVGTGAGWPGLFLAALTGCRSVLTDVPAEGLRSAAARARREAVNASPVRAAGERLPFRRAMFDAVTHSDVLC